MHSPEIVPTVDDESPLISRATPKAAVDRGPRSGDSELCASSMLTTCTEFLAKTAAETINMAALTTPATVMAMNTSIFSSR